MSKPIKWSDEEVARIREMVGAGLTLATIARKFGCDRSVIRGVARLHGFWQKPVAKVEAPRPVAKPEPKDEPAQHKNRWPLPPGSPETWDVINRGTCLAGQEYAP
jgi:hypothetical protein